MVWLIRIDHYKMDLVRIFLPAIHQSSISDLSNTKIIASISNEERSMEDDECLMKGEVETL